MNIDLEKADIVIHRDHHAAQDDDFAVARKLISRINLGSARYGKFDLRTDKRQFLGEALEELLDACIYLSAELIRAGDPEKEELARRNDFLLGDIEEKIKKISSLEGIIEALRDDLEVIRSRNSILVSAIDTYLRQKDVLQKEKNDELFALERANESLRSALADASEKIKALNDDVQKADDAILRAINGKIPIQQDRARMYAILLDMIARFCPSEDGLGEAELAVRRRAVDQIERMDRAAGGDR